MTTMCTIIAIIPLVTFIVMDDLGMFEQKS